MLLPTPKMIGALLLLGAASAEAFSGASFITTTRASTTSTNRTTSATTKPKSGSTAIKSGSTAIKSGSTAIKSGSTTVKSGSTAAKSGSTAIKSGSTSTKSGSVTTRLTTSASKTITSWTTGACTMGTLKVSKQSCASTTITATTTTGCSCPDGNFYMQLSGGKNGPCFDYQTQQGDVMLAIMTTCPSTSTPTTTASAEPSTGTAASFTIKPPPTICKSDDYSFETKMTVPTGYVFMGSGDTGWGPTGSIWNISTGGGAKLVDMKASCQGSSCTGITGNTEGNGQTKQWPDGSWYMNVTSNMQPSLLITGLLVPEDSNATLSERATGNKTYPLNVLGMPPCGLPIAESCANRNFTINSQQWDAYQVDPFMKSYLSSNKLNDFDAFRKKAMEDFEPAMTADSKTCDITNPNFNCLPPQWGDCNTAQSDDIVRGVIMTTAIIEFTNFVAMLYSAVSTVSGRIGDSIDAIVTDFWVPAAAETWTKIMSVISAVIGLLIAAFVLLDALLPEAAWTNGLVVGAIAASNAFGLAGNVGNLVADPSNTDTEFMQGSSYKIGAQNMLNQVMNGFNVLYTNDGVGQDTIKSVLGGGVWVGQEISDAFSKQGLGADSTNWFELLMISRFITKAMTDNDAYLLFIPYGDDIQYNGQKWGFDQTQCEKHWANDPSWKYAASCELLDGPNGKPGMTVFTRPSSENSESKSWAEKPLNYHGTNITTDDIMGSSLWGQQQHGFNFTMLGSNFTGMIAEQGPASAANFFKSMPMSEPGLYNIPVCVITDIAYLPGVSQVRNDMENNNGLDYYSSDNPCSCADYSYTSPDGKSGKFTDFVSQKIKDSIGSGCKIGGSFRSYSDYNGS